MSNKKQNTDQKTTSQKIKADELDNLVLTGLKVKASYDIRWDNTQPEPLKMNATYDFDGIVLGRLIREAVVKHLNVKSAQRWKPKFASVEDFTNRHEPNQTFLVHELLSPMARKQLSPLDSGIKAVKEMDDEQLAKMKEAIAAMEAARAGK